MSRVTRTLATLFSLGFLGLAVGCNETNAKAGEQDQEMRLAQDKIRELQNQLAQADRDRLASQDELDRLRAQLSAARNELASKPEPAPEPGWQNVPGGVMTSIEGTVLFDSGKAALKSNARQTLASIVSVLSQKYPDYDVYVFGHTDNQPIRHSGWKDNYELSCQRALSVVRQLKSQGVRNNASAAGWGDQLPVADNASAGARQANRRVDIYAMRPLDELSGSASAAPPRR
jgi:chemotaxis protein MotB